MDLVSGLIHDYHAMESGTSDNAKTGAMDIFAHVCRVRHYHVIT